MKEFQTRLNEKHGGKVAHTEVSVRQAYHRAELRVKQIALELKAAAIREKRGV